MSSKLKGEDGARDKYAKNSITAGETGTMIAPLKAEFFQVNPGDVEWVDRLSTPQPIGCFVQKLRYTGRKALVTTSGFTDGIAYMWSRQVTTDGRTARAQRSLSIASG